MFTIVAYWWVDGRFVRDVCGVIGAKTGMEAYWHYSRWNKSEPCTIEIKDGLEDGIDYLSMGCSEFVESGRTDQYWER